MVLTLLPMSAFAETADGKPDENGPADGKTTIYWTDGHDYSKLDADGKPVAKGWAWSYQDTSNGNKTIWKSSDSLNGIVAGTSGTSGVWYSESKWTKSSGTDTGALVTNSFTLLSDSLTIDSTKCGTYTSFSVNTNGNALTFGSNVLNKVTSVTITDTAATVGSVSGLSRTVTPYDSTKTGAAQTMSSSGLTLSITDAGVTGGIELKGRGNRVTLTHVDLKGGITMDGSTTVTSASGSTQLRDSQQLTINPKGVLKSAVDGKIAITGNGSQVNLNGVTAKSSAVTVTSTGGSVRLDNSADVGEITVNCGDLNPKETDTPASVTINDGSAAGISYAPAGTGKGASSFTVNTNGTLTGAISTDNGTVAIHAANVKNVTVKQGTLTIDGANGTAGDITLGASGKTTFNFSGTGWTVDKLAATGAKLTIGTNWPATRSNTFKALDLTGYTGAGIKGGTFGEVADTAAKALWFDSSLQFMRKTKDNLYAYYNKQELSTAIAEAKDPAASVKDTLIVIGDKGTTYKYVEFYNSMLDLTNANNPIAQLAYGASTAIYLPDKINGTPVATWTNVDQAKTYSVNELVSLSSQATQDIKLVLQSSGAAVSTLTNVKTKGNNQNVTVTLSNNQINLSGAVGQAAFEDVVLTLTTDLIDSDGDPVEFDVIVSYDTNTKTSIFSTLGMEDPPLGVTVNNNNIVVGSNTYTLSTSGLAKPASNLQVAGITGSDPYACTVSGITGKGIVATVNSSMGAIAKDTLIKEISGSGAEFDWTSSPAMKQVVNQAMTTVTTNNQIENWKTAAQRAAWTAMGYKGKTPTATELETTTGYTQAVLEPYLAVTVTGTYNDSGVMTANLVPSYRVIVVSTIDANNTACAGKNGFTPEGYYIAQAGRALNTPINDLTGGGTAAGVSLKFAGLASGFTTDTVMHQDDAYAYLTEDGKTFVITHAGKTGLGTVTLNKTQPLVSLLHSDGTANQDEKYYDSLQAAIDDTKPAAAVDADKLDTITVSAAYADNTPIDVTGVARDFWIVTEGNTTITPANKNFLVGVDTTGHKYTVQLQKSVAAAGENIVIASATGGSASTNTKNATAGSTVTVTLSASAGYTPSGVTVKTSGGQSVSVSGSGSTYTFTMPSGTVTVTPSFTQTQTVTNATVSVANPNRGSGTAATSVGSNRVAPGTTVTVSTTPGSGQRTMGLNVTGATAYRTGENQFTFTVPSGYSNVVVTPTFDAQNGTSFSDVWSTEYFSPAVAWAVGRGITNGTSTYTFGSYNSCTREDMVTFLYRAAGSPAVGNVRNPFWDVQPGSYYYNAVMWAVSKGITNGVSATQFGVGQNVTRAQAVTFLYRYNGSPAASTNSGFYDVPSSEYFAKAVSWANATGVTNGTSTTAFSPNLNCQRAQIVSFLYRNATGVRA